MKPNEFFSHIRDLITRDKTADALREMRVFLEKTPHLNDILQQSGRLESVRRQNNLGLMSASEASVAREI